MDAIIAGHVLVLVTCLVFVARAGWSAPEPFGAWERRWLWIGPGVGVVAFVVSGVGYVVSQRLLHLDPPPEMGLLRDVTGARLALLMGSVMIAAVLEEWVFRGIVLGAIRGWGAPAAVLASAVVFAAYHLSAFQFLPTFLLGVVLASTVVWLGALWPAVLAHVAFNALGLLLSTLAGATGAGR